MKVGVLTSSRADYGIYKPLLVALENEPTFNLEILAFGTHLSAVHGNTISEIEADGFHISGRIPFFTQDDSPQGIAGSIAKNVGAFAEVWSRSDHDLVFALGDRYEMFAAVSAALPFNKRIAHIHGGETTLGAMDNAFRHAITHMSVLHFTCAEEYKKRVVQLLEDETGVHNVGALSIDGLAKHELLSIDGFQHRFGIDMHLPSILITLHPETVGYGKNETHVRELCAALSELKHYQQIITMPNADTAGQIIRKYLEEYIHQNSNTIKIESFGSLGYRSCMQHCKYMLGNTSSGFIEASFFGKPVINLGHRQDGRIRTPNIVDVEIEKEAILHAVKQLDTIPKTTACVYGSGDAAQQIIQVLESERP